MPVGEKQTYRFGPFELDTQCGQLRKDGIGLKLQGQPVQILKILLEHPGQLVTREELRQRLWASDTFVDFDHSLNTAIKKLRQALGDEADTPRYIETLPRRGYRFIGQIPTEEGLQNISETAPLDGSPVVAAEPSQRARLRYQLTAASAVVILAAASVGYWLAHRSPPSGLQMTEFLLTANSAENRLTRGAISPDGKYLAYGDTTGLHLKLIQTGEISNIPNVPGMDPGNWWPNSWFPDGTKFITAGFEPGGSLVSTWVVSVIGAPPVKLMDNADPWSVSPDGKLIVFGKGGGFNRSSEIWMMGPRAEEPRRLIAGSENERFYWAKWSPDGQRIAYWRFRRKADGSEARIQSCDLNGGTPVLILSDPRLIYFDENFLWLPAGRFVFSMLEPRLKGGVNLWEIELNPRMGAPVSTPRRITNWAADVRSVGLSVTSDSKQVAVTKFSWQFDVYTAELKPEGGHVGRMRRLTLNDNDDFAGQWMADSRTMLFSSNRNGGWGIYKQRLDQTDADLVVTGSDYKENPLMSPDGSWILYLSSSTGDIGGQTPVRVMRVSPSGGIPQVVFEEPGINQIACAHSSASYCVFSKITTDEKQLALEHFDPMNGRGAEITRIAATHPGSDVTWDLSGDGSHLAIGKRNPDVGRIRILPISGASGSPFDIETRDWNGWKGLNNLSWAADGRSLFVVPWSAIRPHEPPVLAVDMRGSVRVAWRQSDLAGFNDTGRSWVASPDGRYLATTIFRGETNVWLLENF